jgi:hypothetical protein
VSLVSSAGTLSVW